MKTRIFSNFLAITSFALLCTNSFAQIKTETLTTPGTANWSTPYGLKTLKVEMWGAGGGGGVSTSSNKDGGAGGGGGAYARFTYNLTSWSSTISYVIGAGGISGSNGVSSRWTANAQNIIANAGNGGNITTAGSGGAVTSFASFSGLSNTASFAGGSGGSGSTEDNAGGAGGGQGANSDAAGGAGAAATNSANGKKGGVAPGASILDDGGIGGDGGNSSTPINGYNGQNPGGGGGGAGAFTTSSYLGGTGGNGKINVTYLPIDYYHYSDVLTPVTSTNSPTIPAGASYYTVAGIRYVKFYLQTPSSVAVTSAITSSDIKVFLNDASTSEITSQISINSNGSGFDIVIPASILKVATEYLPVFVQVTKSGYTNYRQINFIPSALPVILNNFSIKESSSNSVSLNWSTSSEIINKGFSIERQTNNANGKFESIGFVASKATGGNSQTPLYYSFTDEMPSASATNFYRLAQQDLDGKISYSEIRSVKMGKETVTMLFPNPSNGVVNISRTNNGKKMNIIVVDQSGRVITQVNNITEPTYKLNNLRPGIYNVKMMYPETGEQSVQKVVVQK